MKSTLQVVKLLGTFRKFSIQSQKQQRGNMSKKSFFYAVKRGHQPGVYKTWDECLKQVSGFSCASYRKFPTYEEAVKFSSGLLTVSNKTAAPAEVTPLPPGPYSTSLMPAELQPTPIVNSKKRRLKGNMKQSQEEMPQLKKQRTSRSDNDLVATLVSRVEGLEKELAILKGNRQPRSGTLEVNESVTKQVKTDKIHIPNQMIHVYTDGACTKNGAKNACAGIGVYWGPDHPLNVSERISGRQTNNRAEIMAAARALNQAKSVGIQELTLYTDSIFVINGITKWIKKWKRNGWKLSTGQPVINKSDFEELEKAQAGLTVKWVHVPGHKGFAGNEAADHLAVQGLKKPLVETID